MATYWNPSLGEAQEPFILALLSAFRNEEELEEFLGREMGVSLNVEIPDGILRYRIFRLVEWATARERLRELMTAAQALRPGNQKLRDILSASPGFVAPESWSATTAHDNEFAGTRESSEQLTVPLVWNVPRPVEHFTGRTEWLERLEKQLAPGVQMAVTQAISGLGGVGKTQLALAYAYRHGSSYRVVWWIRAETDELRLQDLGELARQLAVATAGDHPQDWLPKLRRWLGDHSNWLLIFDNVENPAAVTEALPTNYVGHIILTSRLRNWDDRTRVLSLSVWTPEEATAYLLERTAANDFEAAQALAETLGRLPLALEQAAAYIDECQVSLARYVQLFRKSRGRLLRWRSSGNTAVATTWELSLQAVRSQCEDAVTLLNLLAFLPPDNFSRDRLHGGASGLPVRVRTVLADQLSLNQAIATLRRYSLIEATQKHVSVHRLLQVVVKDALSNREYRSFDKAAHAIQFGDSLDEAGAADSGSVVTGRFGIKRPLMVGATLFLAAVALALYFRMGTTPPSDLLALLSGELDLSSSDIGALDRAKRRLLMRNEPGAWASCRKRIHPDEALLGGGYERGGLFYFRVAYSANVEPLQKQAFKAGMEMWNRHSATTGFYFEESTASVVDILFQRSAPKFSKPVEEEKAGCAAYNTDSAIWYSPENMRWVEVDTDIAVAARLYAHELGHALNLSHKGGLSMMREGDAVTPCRDLARFILPEVIPPDDLQAALFCGNEIRARAKASAHRD